MLEVGQGLPPEVQAHLHECAPCRGFAELHRQLLSARPACAPSSELDDKVLAAGKAVLREQRIVARAASSRCVDMPLNFGRGRSPARTKWPWQWFAAACAALGLTLLLAFLLSSASLTPEQASIAGRDQGPETLAGQPRSGVWAESDLDLELLCLEAELVFAVLDNALAVDTNGAGGGTDGEVGRHPQSIDDLLLEMELDLWFDRQWWLESARQNGA